MSCHATTSQTVIDRVAHPFMAVMMFARMRLLVRSVISGMGLGRGGDGCMGVRVFERDDASELSDHEKADQKPCDFHFQVDSMRRSGTSHKSATAI